MLNNLFSGFEENPFYTKMSESAMVFLGIIVLLFIAYVLRSKKNRKLPPGPIGLPLFGYYFFLKRNPMKTLNELAKKYGNIFGLYIGPKYAVFLNDWEAVKDGLGQNATLDRSIGLFEKVPFKFGFGGSNGAEWVETRRLASKVMKDGLQRNQWEDLIEKELCVVVEKIKSKDGSPIEIRSCLRDSFSKIVVNLLLGDNLEERDSISKMVTKAVDFMTENLQTIQMFNFSEILALVLWKLGLEDIPPIPEKTRDFIKFVSDNVDSNTHTSSSEENDSFISRFKEEVVNRKKANESTYASEDNLKGTIVALMVGGNETTLTSVIWALIAMAEHPDKQQKVHEELDKAFGKEESIRWSERAKVPYTLAALLESQRWRTTVPVPAMRIVVEDTQIQGYHIPKGTSIATNIWYLHNDPRYWEHPDRFIPERFLLEDGRKVNMSPDSYIPFSYGKRNCPGRLLSLMDMLQYFSTLMQKFKVSPKDGDKVKYKELLGLSFQARDVELRFVPR